MSETASESDDPNNCSTEIFWGIGVAVNFLGISFLANSVVSGWGWGTKIEYQLHHWIEIFVPPKRFSFHPHPHPPLPPPPPPNTQNKNKESKWIITTAYNNTYYLLCTFLNLIHNPPHYIHTQDQKHPQAQNWLPPHPSPNQGNQEHLQLYFLLIFHSLLSANAP